MTNPAVLRSVLNHARNVVGTGGNFVVFAKPPDGEEEGIKREVWINPDDFAVLGSPEQITVVIEAGDKLNESYEPGDAAKALLEPDNG